MTKNLSGGFDGILGNACNPNYIIGQERQLRFYYIKKPSRS